MYVVPSSGTVVLPKTILRDTGYCRVYTDNNAMHKNLLLSPPHLAWAAAPMVKA